jgi:hypothetical protein
VAKPAYEWRLERARWRQRHRAGSGLSGGRCSGLPRRRRGAWSARGFWLPLEGPATARRVVATKGARSGKRFVRRGLTRRATKSGSVSSEPGPEKERATGPCGRPRPSPDAATRPGWKPPETEVEATPNTAGRHSPTVLVTRDRSGSARHHFDAVVDGSHHTPAAAGQRWCAAGSRRSSDGLPSAGGNQAFHRVLVENSTSCRRWQEASVSSRSRSPDQPPRGVADEPAPQSPSVGDP